MNAEMNKGLQCDTCHVSLMSHDHAAHRREVEVMVDLEGHTQAFGLGEQSLQPV